MPIDRRKEHCFNVSLIATHCLQFVIICLCFLLSHTPAEPSSFLCPSQCTCSYVAKTVNCSNRSLRKLPSRIPQEVVILSFHNNKIAGTELRDEVFNHLTHLKSLDLSDNRLRVFNLTFPPNLPLNNLVLDKCLLVDIPIVKGAKNITNIFLSHNSIQTIADKLKHWSYLQLLDLSFNKIRVLFNRTFHHLTSLSTLNLCKNRINIIEVDAFHSLAHLEKLVLCRNKIRDLRNFTFMASKSGNSKIFQNLQHLDLSRNYISKVDGLTFKGMYNLKTLLLSHNRIFFLGHGAFYSLNSLATLFLDHNHLQSVVNHWLYDLKSLRNLSLSHNNISVMNDVAWKFCPDIEVLNISHNQLRRLRDGLFKLLPRLNQLDLSQNSISVINKLAFVNLGQLHFLNLSHNHISSTIEDIREVFKGLVSLSSIDLSTNKIRALDSAIFDGLQLISSINLLHNNITSIANLTFDGMTELRQLSMDSASLLCDCKLAGFTDWLSLQSALKQSVNATCFHPPALKGKQLLELKVDELVCGEHPVPSLLQQPGDTQVHKGENVTLECSASATLSKEEGGLASVNMTATWRRGPSKDNIIENESTRIRNTQRVEGSHVFFTSFLLLYHVRYDNNDKYSCVIRNEFGHAVSKPAQLTVVSFPRFVLRPENKTVKFDSEVMIDCQAMGHPETDILWEKEGGNFAAADEYRMILSNRKGEAPFLSDPSIDLNDLTDIVPLHINPVKPVDAGRYKCIAKNQVGVQSAYVTLTVLYPPFIEGMPPTVTAYPGESPVLKCMVRAYPSARVRWTFNNSSLQQTSRHFLVADRQLLVIIGMKERDQGFYSCSVSNGLGKRRKTTRLLLATGRTTGSDKDGFWDSLWGTPGVILVVSICVLSTFLIWLLFCFCYRTRSQQPEPDKTGGKTEQYYDIPDSQMLSPPHVIHDHVAQLPPPTPSGRSHALCYSASLRSLLRDSRNDLAPPSTCCSTLPDRVRPHVSTRFPRSTPDVAHCKPRRPLHQRRALSRRVASSDSSAPSSDGATSSDDDHTSQSEFVAQETALVPRKGESNDPT